VRPPSLAKASDGKEDDYGDSRQQLLNDLPQPQVGFVSRWFPKVRRGPKDGALHPIILGVRGRDNKHRGPGASLASADAREYFNTAHFRKIQVEKKQLRTASVGVSIDAGDESDGLLAILHQMKFNVQIMGRDRLSDQEHVSRVVLNQYDRGR
jgi:hypothetical protein